jgi:hypothetical protein
MLTPHDFFRRSSSSIVTSDLWAPNSPRTRSAGARSEPAKRLAASSSSKAASDARATTWPSSCATITCGVRVLGNPDGAKLAIAVTRNRRKTVEIDVARDLEDVDRPTFEKLGEIRDRCRTKVPVGADPICQVFGVLQLAHRNRRLRETWPALHAQTVLEADPPFQLAPQAGLDALLRARVHQRTGPVLKRFDLVCRLGDQIGGLHAQCLGETDQHLRAWLSQTPLVLRQGLLRDPAVHELRHVLERVALGESYVTQTITKHERPPSLGSRHMAKLTRR